MATRTGPVNLLVVTQDELSQSVQKLAVAAFHRLKSGFVERFLSHRELHFDHFQTNVIDPDTIFQSRVEDVGDGTQIPSSSEAVSGGVAEVEFGVTSVLATEGGQVTSRLSAPTGRVSDSNFFSAGNLPRPFLPLDVTQSTMVTDPGR